MEFDHSLGDRAERHIGQLLVAYVEDEDDERHERIVDEIVADGAPLLAHVVSIMVAHIMRHHSSDRPASFRVYDGEGRVVEPSTDTPIEAGRLAAARLCVTYANDDGEMFRALFEAVRLGRRELLSATLFDLTRHLNDALAHRAYVQLPFNASTPLHGAS